MLALLAAAPPGDAPPTPPDATPTAASPAVDAPPAGAVSATPSADSPATANERPRVLVLDLAHVGVDAEAARLVSGIVASLAAENRDINVVTSADLRAMLDLEATTQALGCDATSCLAEVAGAVDASFIVYGDLGKLGERYVVTINLFEAAAGVGRGRRTVEAASLETMPSVLRPALNNVLGPLGGIPLTDAMQPANAVDGLAIAGGVITGVGTLGLVGAGIAALVLDGVASDAGQSIADKTAAINNGRIALVVAGASLVVAGIGGGLLVAGLLD